MWIDKLRIWYKSRIRGLDESVHKGPLDLPVIRVIIAQSIEVLVILAGCSSIGWTDVGINCPWGKLGSLMKTMNIRSEEDSDSKSEIYEIYEIYEKSEKAKNWKSKFTKVTKFTKIAKIAGMGGRSRWRWLDWQEDRTVRIQGWRERWSCSLRRRRRRRKRARWLLLLCRWRRAGKDEGGMVVIDVISCLYCRLLIMQLLE